MASEHYEAGRLGLVHLEFSVATRILRRADGAGKQGGGCLALRRYNRLVRQRPGIRVECLAHQGHPKFAVREAACGPDCHFDRSPGALGAYRFHLNGGGLKAPNDPRNLNARVFRIGRAGASSSLRTRDIAAGDGVILGDGWYPYEYFGGETFRWFDNDACFTLVADRAGSVSVDVTVEPGPGVGCAPFTLEVRDGAGRTVAQRTVRGRETLRFSLPVDSPPPATGTAPARVISRWSASLWKREAM